MRKTKQRWPFTALGAAILLTTSPSPATAAPIDVAIAENAVACAGFEGRSRAARDFADVLVTQGYREIEDDEARTFREGVGFRGDDDVYTVTFADTGASLIIAFDDAVCAMLSMTADPLAVAGNILNTEGRGIQWDVRYTLLYGSSVPEERHFLFAVAGGGVRFFLRIIGGTGEPGAAVWVYPEDELPPDYTLPRDIPWPDEP